MYKYILLLTVFFKKKKQKQRTKDYFRLDSIKKKLITSIYSYTNRTIINSNFTFKSVSIFHIVSKTRGEIDHTPNYTYTYRDSRYM